MPKIRDLIPTDNLSGDQFAPWLDMDLEDYYQNYQQSMQGDSSGRAGAIAVGNLLGLESSNQGGFLPPGADYQSQWDSSGNWTPTNESDLLSLAYEQGNRG